MDAKQSSAAKAKIGLAVIFLANLSAPAYAFDLDRFQSGMSIAEVMAIDPAPVRADIVSKEMKTSGLTTYDSGLYSFMFCNKKLVMVTKTMDRSGFFSTLIDFTGMFDQPKLYVYNKENVQVVGFRWPNPNDARSLQIANYNSDTTKYTYTAQDYHSCH